MHNMPTRLLIKLFVLLSMTVGCDNSTTEPASATPPTFDESLEIPRVDILNLDRWLGMRLTHARQLRLLDERNLAQKDGQQIQIIRKCNEEWSKFEYVSVTNWPRKGTHAHVDFFMLDDKIELAFIDFSEIFEPIYKKEERGFLDKAKSKFGLEENVDYRDKNYVNALDSLDKHARKNCAQIFQSNKTIGYQCEGYGISRLERFPFFPLTAPMPYMDELEKADTHDLTPRLPAELIATQLKLPESPIQVQHRVCDGCYGGWLVLYKDKESLLHFLSDIDLLREGGCTRVM